MTVCVGDSSFSYMYGRKMKDHKSAINGINKSKK